MTLSPRELRFQARALRQIDEALGYVQARSPQGAAKIEARLSHLLQRLRQHHNSASGRPSPMCVEASSFPILTWSITS